MQDYSNSMSSLSEVQRIIGLSLSKIQIGRNQRGGLPLHKNLLVATVLNKARDLYMQETMYMNYKMMTGQLGAAQMTCMAMHAPQQQQQQCPNPGVVIPTLPRPNQEEEEETPEQQQEQQLGYAPAPVAPAESEPVIPNPGPATPRTSDEGFIDEPDCDCDARNFSSESSRVPFTYCYQCAPFHPSNGRGPTLVPADSKSSTLGGPPEGEASGSSTIYDMDSKAQESRSSSHSRKRSLSGDSASDGFLDAKRNRSSEDSEGPYIHQHHQQHHHSPISHGSSEVVNSNSDSSSSCGDEEEHQQQVFHPAFRQCSGPPSGGHHHSFPHQHHSSTSPQPTVPASMEIEQITSLVSIFSFGQQIMAAAVEANKRLQQKSFQSAEQAAQQLRVTEASQSEEEEEGEVEDNEPLPNSNVNNNNDLSDNEPTEVREEGITCKKDPSSEDSDSESDTSSDSGHSSDDLEASSPEENLKAASSTGSSNAGNSVSSSSSGSEVGCCSSEGKELLQSHPSPPPQIAIV